MGLKHTLMLCNDCENLPKCECCGKPIKQDAQPHDTTPTPIEQQVKEDLPLESKAGLPVATKPLIPAVPLDDEKIPADKPRKPLIIQPVEELNNLTDVFMKGW